MSMITTQYMFLCQEHLSDEKYRLLMADLQLLSASDAELPVIKNYIQVQLMDVTMFYLYLSAI